MAAFAPTPSSAKRELRSVPYASGVFCCSSVRVYLTATVKWPTLRSGCDDCVAIKRAWLSDAFTDTPFFIYKPCDAVVKGAVLDHVRVTLALPVGSILNSLTFAQPLAVNG